jgi:hypothetical protein
MDESVKAFSVAPGAVLQNNLIFAPGYTSAKSINPEMWF